MDKNKRVEIAKDVLAQLDMGKIKARHEVYLCLVNKMDVSNDEQEVKEVFESQTCESCAYGALFFSAVLKFNELKNKDFFDDDTLHEREHFFPEVMRDYLYKYFDYYTLCLIETAFEGRVIQADCIDDELRGAIIFGVEAGPLPEQKMRAIMQNIISHNGDFIVQPYTEGNYDKYFRIEGGEYNE